MRPIVLINSSDEMVYREPLRLSHIRWITDGRARWCHVFTHYKTLETTTVGLRSDASDAFPVHLISTVITREINGVD